MLHLSHTLPYLTFSGIHISFIVCAAHLWVSLHLYMPKYLTGKPWLQHIFKRYEQTMKRTGQYSRSVLYLEMLNYSSTFWVVSHFFNIFVLNKAVHQGTIFTPLLWLSSAHLITRQRIIKKLITLSIISLTYKKSLTRVLESNMTHVLNPLRKNLLRYDKNSLSIHCVSTTVALYQSVIGLGRGLPDFAAVIYRLAFYFR